MKRLAVVLALAFVLSVALGCVFPTGAIIAPIVSTKSAISMGDSQVGQSKIGRAQAEGILLMAFGDASITAACANSGIKRVHHVDSEELNVLGIYARRTTIVYGE